MGEQEDKAGAILDEVAKAAAEKEAAALKAKSDADAAAASKKDADAQKPIAKDQRTLDEMIKDPKIRDQIKSVRGWTDSQLDASYMQAPLQEKVARYEIKDKYKDFDEHKEFIDKELQQVAIFDRTPQVMERLYWMAKGKQGIEKPAKQDDSRKVGERIHTSYPAPASGSGEGGSGKASTLSEEEKFVADSLGVPYDKYEASKKGHRPDRAESTKYIRPPEPHKVPQGGNSADQALGVLLKPRGR